MKAKPRIGILGGSFDPVHWGHILLAREALRFAELDYVLLLVARDPPHKTLHASASERLEMARLAVEDETKIYASDLELKMTGKIYAVDALRGVKRHHPDAELFYLIGSDLLATLPYWYKSEELFSLVHILCAVRQERWGSRAELIADMREQHKIPLQIMEVDIPDISSSRIRSWLREGRLVTDWVPTAVEKYIKERGLYLGEDAVSEENLFFYHKQ